MKSIILMHFTQKDYSKIILFKIIVLLIAWSDYRRWPWNKTAEKTTGIINIVVIKVNRYEIWINFCQCHLSSYKLLLWFWISIFHSYLTLWSVILSIYFIYWNLFHSVQINLAINTRHTFLIRKYYLILIFLTVLSLLCRNLEEKA